MSYDTSALRDAVEVPGFPYKAREVTFLHIDVTGAVTFTSTVGGKRRMLSGLGPGELLVAAWTGQWRTDMFALDVEVARAALGL